MSPSISQLQASVSEIYIFKKGKHIAFRKYHQDNFNNMDQLLFFCDESQIFEQNYKMVIITFIGQYTRRFYKLSTTSLYKYMQLVVWIVFGHQDIVPVNISTFNTLSKHLTAIYTRLGPYIIHSNFLLVLGGHLGFNTFPVVRFFFLL